MFKPAVCGSIMMLALLAAGCNASTQPGEVRDRTSGLGVQFQEKWRFDKNISQLPRFVERASRFTCEVDRCGRRGIGVGAFGNAPPAGPRGIPSEDSVVALLDALLSLNGGLRGRHVTPLTIAGYESYRVRFQTRRFAGGGPVVMTHLGNIIFHNGRFLFFGVTSMTHDQDTGEDLLDEVARSLEARSKSS